ncbi:MAG TPA: AmmeMemoRadiSam system protein A [Clostridia bacterium]|nr:AmmeMemoRadiSam system protein A [Clostridia bacterium]
MGKIINGYILPHPPIIVPTVGRGSEKAADATIQAVKRVAKEIAKDNPSTIIITSPHAPCFRDYVYISDSEILSGNFAGFNCPQIKLDFENNTSLASLISENAIFTGIGAGGIGLREKEKYGISDELDHGAMVPLYFISQELHNFKIVHISTPFMPFDELYQFGNCIRDAVEQSDERIVFVASGDLSHRLTHDAPAGYNPKGHEYDDYLIDKLNNSDIEGLLHTEESFLEAAGECGTRSFIIMLGALDGKEIKTDIYSYEGPFGVGYLVSKVNVHEKANINDISADIVNSKNSICNLSNSVGKLDRDKSDYVKLAREALETFVKENRRIKAPDWLPSQFLNNRAGVFVSIKKNGQLRGCIGTISPTKKNLAEEIINNAISAGTQDPRFRAVRESELSDLVYSIDVLGAPEKIASIDELDVKRYGVIVTSGFRRGLLLPDLDGVDTPEEQIDIALQKAGIESHENYSMERFEVIRYK